MLLIASGMLYAWTGSKELSDIEVVDFQGKKLLSIETDDAEAFDNGPATKKMERFAALLKANIWSDA